MALGKSFICTRVTVQISLRDSRLGEKVTGNGIQVFAKCESEVQRL